MRTPGRRSVSRLRAVPAPIHVSLTKEEFERTIVALPVSATRRGRSFRTSKEEGSGTTGDSEENDARMRPNSVDSMSTTTLPGDLVKGKSQVVVRARQGQARGGGGGGLRRGVESLPGGRSYPTKGHVAGRGTGHHSRGNKRAKSPRANSHKSI